MTIVFILTITAFILVVASLVIGLISMGRGGEFDHKYSTYFMSARVGFQAVAVLLLMLLAFMLYE